MIGIVIPFFQRTPGLLNRALRSIAAQESAHSFHVYVVDDSSPVSAESELAGLGEDFSRHVTILRQPNGGPGAARNLALDRAAADTEFVAFLDSDDAWTSKHLNHVEAAFAAGADFYFAEHQREEDAQSRFVQCAFRPDGGAVAGSDGSVFWCDARALSRAVMMRSPIGTSTVAIRRDKIGGTRFNTRLRSAGEDSIFWLEILRTNIKVACGATLEGALGRGVSVFNHRGWGNAAALRTALDEMRTQIHLRRNFSLDRGLTAQSQKRCHELDEAFCLNLLACIRRGNWPPLGLVLAYLGQRPLMPLHLPVAATGAIWRKMRPSSPLRNGHG
jgi:succinoglycan biosynthesis protein ExoW